MLKKVTVPVRKITTEDMRAYLSEDQKMNNCSKVTVDNVRRNISSFFLLVGRGKLYLKESHAKDSQNKDKPTGQGIISDEDIERLRDKCACKRDWR